MGALTRGVAANENGVIQTCQLCRNTSGGCIEISKLPFILPPSFIKQQISIEVSDTSLICESCIKHIKEWKAFVELCIKAQNSDSLSHQENVGSENTPIKTNTSQTKKSKFTVEYVTQKIGKELEQDEIEKLTKVIEKGDRAVYAFLFGSGSNQSWPCQLCKVIIKGTMKSVDEHYEIVHQSHPLYPCQLCGKVIKSSHTFKRHRTTHFSEYKCSRCEKVFQDRSKLLAHQITHTEHRPHKCNECGKLYKLASHLKAHLRTHVTEHSFTCEKCGKQFKSKGNLTTHVQSTHSEIKPFVCELCGKGVKSKQALQFHLNSHSGIKQFTCHVCSLSFTSRSSMKSHVRRHTGERPYPCRQCDKTFTSSSARSSHRLHVHATSREHVCPHCCKGFKVLRDLKVHISIHTGEKPYVCDTCGKTFRVAANFYAHRKRHKKTEETSNDALTQAIQEHFSDSELVFDNAQDISQGSVAILNRVLL